MTTGAIGESLGGDDVAEAHQFDRRLTLELFTGLSPEALMRIGFAVASRKLSSRQDREDVVQEAFTRLIAAAESAREPLEFGGAYFAQTVQRVIVDLWKARVRRKRGGGAADVPLDDGVSIPDPSASPAQIAERDALRRAILAAIATLSAKNREVILLALDLDSGDFNRMSHLEMAAELRVSPHIVKSRLHEAKKKLATALAEWRQEETT